MLYRAFEEGAEIVSAFADSLPITGLDLLGVAGIALLLAIAGVILVRRSGHADADRPGRTGRRGARA